MSTSRKGTLQRNACIVIGAGLAGLAAAYHLTRENWKVTVLEATDRLGGRVMTHHFDEAPELNCELGGEWIGEDHLEMQRLCRELHLELQPHKYANSFWNQTERAHLIAPGVWCMSHKSKKIWNKFQRDFQKFKEPQFRELDKLDWWTKLAELGFDRTDLLRRDLMDSTDFGETIRMNSAYTAATEYLSSKNQRVNNTDEMDFKVLGGNKRLVNALVKSIGHDNIRMKCEVMSIRQTNGYVTVHPKGHDPLSAAFCVCAIPAHRVASIHWREDPPVQKIEAAKQLQYARITKTAVLCSHRFWPRPKRGGFSVCTSLASDFCFDSTHEQGGERRILCSYAVGDKADDIASSPEQDLKNWIVEDVAHAYSIPWSSTKSNHTALAIRQQPWQKEFFIGGAYAFYRPGQWFTVRPLLSRSFKRVFFAGEHIADWQGFMEGAVVTGKAAADAILRH
jgi:monoamine oxidase